eukprot:UN17913
MIENEKIFSDLQPPPSGPPTRSVNFDHTIITLILFADHSFISYFMLISHIENFLCILKV